MISWIEPALLLAVLSTGLMAGIYFTFSVFVMRALKRLPVDVAIACMNSINTVIVKSAFLPLFFGSGLLVLLLIIVNDGGLASVWIISASVIYLLGMLGCTVVFNVPLNNRLQSVNAENKALIWGIILFTGRAGIICELSAVW
ncbi:DUF1772 domain-containing protein [Oceanicoccus sp. KOV_DT_Chl]|uniref:anthrone oxygenase family protein n=1 Tax=Oceanicoccus sp. KOV_DT_Chl TaxID=1904639 RepID=UPI000C7C37C2|nr:anthrone oxygenase family protein [Oceanicoccus sp. KOV_DT_Chl]